MEQAWQPSVPGAEVDGWERAGSEEDVAAQRVTPRVSARAAETALSACQRRWVQSWTGQGLKNDLSTLQRCQSMSIQRSFLAEWYYVNCTR